MKVAHRKAPEPHVPFIALADIAWQLIIFFLVTSTFTKNDALTFELPNSNEEAQQEQNEDTITVQASQASLLLNEKPLELKELQTTLAGMLAGKTADAERIVVMMAADDLTFQRDLDIKFAIKRAGGIVALMAEDETGGEAE